jgi:phosphonate transport system ATP-binding protein
MLEFVGISKSFKDGTLALNDVRFSVPQGQFCVILGPSGAGKSTLLRTVNGLSLPGSGEVRLDGQAVTTKSLKTLRPQIGMIHQGFNLAMRATVADNVIAGVLPVVPTWRALLGLFTPEQRLRACRLIEAVGLDEDHLRRRVSELSGGQQQRVGIARAFMLDPKLILADEPVASLDPKISDDIIRLIKFEARRRGSTVLCSLHQLDLARAYADRIIALKAGRVVFDGPPETLDAAKVSGIYGTAFKPPTLAPQEEMA